ncbi:MAG: transcriptional repressor [Lachnospiraceae bacterium]|nr:transcriptional repressor [Lachnospiraceae bacterium]
MAKSEYKTRPRNAIIKYLQDHPDTRFTARDILEGIGGAGAEADRSTIYRNLERLCQEGVLVKYKETDVNATCYQYSGEHGSCHDHMHGQCAECGRIFHLENGILADAAEKMESEYGLAIDYGKTVIIGLCRDCRKKAEKKIRKRSGSTS